MRRAPEPRLRAGTAAVAAACLGVVSSRGVARADAPGVSARLTWARLPGAEACPDGASLASDVAQRLGYDPFARSEPLHFVDGAVRPTRSGFEADLTFRGADGEPLGQRHLDSKEGADCRALARASALAIAVALDPEAALLPPEERVAAEPEPVVRGEGDRTSPRVQARDRESLPRSRSATPPAPAPGPELSVSARLESQLGTLPVQELAWGPGLGTALRWPSGLRVALAAFYLPAVEDDGIGFALVGGWLDGCFEPAVAERLRLGVCARVGGGAHLSFVDVRGPVLPNVEAYDAGEHAWWAAGAVARARVALPAQVFLELEAGATFGLVRRRFVVTQTEGGTTVSPYVYREPPAAFVGAAAVGVAFE